MQLSTPSPTDQYHQHGGKGSFARAIAAALGLPGQARRDPARILLGMLMPIGDTLFAQPAIAALRRRYPQARLTALTWPTNAPIVAANPDIDETIIYHNDPDGQDFVDRFDSVMQSIYARRFEMLVSFAPSSNCVGMVSGIPRQVWLRLPFCFWLWGTACDPSYATTHTVDRYWRVVHELGLAPRGMADRVPQWQVSVAEQATAHATLSAVGVTFDPARPLILIHPGAAGFGGRKRWPVGAFGQLATQLIAEHQAQIVVLGGPGDAEDAACIVSATDGQAHTLAGQLSLRQSIALIPHARLYLGNDSGLTHFAVALQRPTVALYGVSSLAQFAPRAADPRLVQVLLPHPVPAPAGFFIGTKAPLARHASPDDRMERISVARVYDAAQALLFPQLVG
jgi:lipopolysaccharide heptosyltransferase II